MSTIREAVKLTNAGKCISELKQERDTYRDLCVELIGIIKEHMNYVDLSIHIEFKDAITKAEAILGEKNGIPE